MKGYKKFVVPAIILSMVAVYIGLPGDTVQAAELRLGDVELGSVVVQGEYYVYSNYSVQIFGEVTVTPSSGKKVTRVVLKEKATGVIKKELSKSADNKYVLGKIYPEANVDLRGTTDQMDAVFTWFRDPTKQKVWMYDLEGYRNYYRNLDVYDSPQINADYVRKPIGSPFPTDAEFASAPVVYNGNAGWTKKVGDLPYFLSGDGLDFEVTKLTSITPTYLPRDGGVGYTKPTAVHPPETIAIDYEARTLTYKFLATYSSPIYRTTSGSSGLVNEYRTAWEISLSATVYKYPQMEIVYYEEPIAGSSPSSPSPSASPAPKPSGDFDITPSTINFRDPFKLVPKNFNIPTGCTYQSHEFKMQSGSNWTSPKLTSQTQQLSFNYPTNYPAPIRTGSVTVSMQITASCGQSDWVTHTLTVNGTPNNPPYFKLGWFHDGDISSIKPLTEVLVGTKLMVRYIEDPNSNPASPSDPDNDPISVKGWDFSQGGPWVSTLPSKYGFTDQYMVLPGITMDTLGYHTVYSTMADNQGGSYTTSAMVKVIPPNPIAACTVTPNYVKARKAIPDSAFSGAESRSPMGRAISTYTWRNKKTTYENLTADPIYETIYLHVTDSEGLHSLTEGSCTLRVDPNPPPIGKLDVPPLGLRSKTYDFYNKSYSTDGDPIVSTTYKIRYDSNNNGFSDDPFMDLTGELIKASYTPQRVGQYEIHSTATDIDGQTATASGIIQIINLAPTVAFDVLGQNKQPTLPTRDSFSPNTILSTWTLTKTNSTAAVLSKNWYEAGGMVTAGLGRGYEHQYLVGYTYNAYDGYGEQEIIDMVPFNDNGLGVNRLSPYRAIKGTTVFSQPLMVPKNNSLTDLYGDPVVYDSIYSWDLPKITLRSSDTHLFFNYNDNFYALNKSKLGGYTFDHDITGGYLTGIKHKWVDRNPYDYIINANNLTTTKKFDQVRFEDYLSFVTWDVTKMTSTGTQVTPTSPTLLGYQVSDRTIYQVIQWNLPKSAYYGSNTTVYNTYAFEIRSYDIFTGTYLTSTFDVASDHLQMITYGAYPLELLSYQDNLILSRAETVARSSISYDQIGSVIRKFDRSGNLVSKKVLPERAPYRDTDIAANCQSNLSEWYKGMNGDLYQYSQLSCSPSSGYTINKDTILQKFDLNTMTFKWKTLIDTGGFTMYSWPHDMMIPTMLINPIKGEIVTRTGLSRTHKIVNMETGVITNVGPYITTTDGQLGNFSQISSTDNFFIDETGNYRSQKLPYQNYYSGATVTIEGLRTFHQTPWGDYKPYLTRVSSTPGTDYAQWSGWGSTLGATSWSSTAATGKKVFGEYFGDGLFLGIFHTVSGGVENKKAYSPWLFTGPVSDLPAVSAASPAFGQFTSPLAVLPDVKINFSLKMDKANSNNELAGFSFRMADQRNRNALETDGSVLYLSKYVSGVRTVLKSIPYAFQDGLTYNMTIKTIGSQIDVELEGVPYMTVTDSTYTAGKMGPYSNKPFVSFGTVSTESVSLPNVDWFSGYAIWEDGEGKADVKYSNLTFTDPENDPQSGSYEWSYTHTPKFLNNQGLSNLSGMTFPAGQVIFDKVGLYDIQLRATDDPHPAYLYPSNVFGTYRKASNPFIQKLTVHRRPLAVFANAIEEDGSVTWTDESYDPDRWLSSTEYTQPDSTGINYQNTRGIMERKYFYTSPSGVYVESKLVRPQEIGTYQVGLQVKDEYGAWSVPVVKQLTTTKMAPPNNKPTVQLTSPNGISAAAAVLVDSQQPVITWNQADLDLNGISTAPGRIFTGYNVRVLNEDGSPAAMSGQSSVWTFSTSMSWNVTVPLVRGKKYQVQVQVEDGAEWSDWSNIGWMVINSKPTATLSAPDGTEASPTLIHSNTRPTFEWNQVDPERDTFGRFELDIYDASGNRIDTTGNQSQNTNLAAHSYVWTRDLPTGELLHARVRVTDHDPSMWSDWSDPVWFIINHPPAVSITDPSGTLGSPSIVGPSPVIRYKLSDPNPNTVYSQLRIRIRSEDGLTEFLNQTSATQLTDSTGSYSVPIVLPYGRKLQADMKVWDQYGAESAWSAPVWMFTNRPPAADFDWQPKPIWEGDNVRLFSLSQDPEGTPLTFNWTIQTPAGEILTHNTEEWRGVWTQPGMYQVRLEVSDGWSSAGVAKSVEVRPLTLTADVLHTPAWLKIHEEMGHQTVTTPKDFYSGERLVAYARSAPAPVDEVTAWLEAELQGGDPLRVETALAADTDGPGGWSGELFDEKLASLTERLPNGLQLVHFHIRYANGVEKTTDIPINIIGSIHEAVQVHRIQ